MPYFRRCLFKEARKKVHVGNTTAKNGAIRRCETGNLMKPSRLELGMSPSCSISPLPAMTRTGGPKPKARSLALQFKTHSPGGSPDKSSLNLPRLPKCSKIQAMEVQTDGRRYDQPDDDTVESLLPVAKRHGHRYHHMQHHGIRHWGPQIAMSG